MNRYSNLTDIICEHYKSTGINWWEVLNSEPHKLLGKIGFNIDIDRFRFSPELDSDRSLVLFTVDRLFNGAAGIKEIINLKHRPNQELYDSDDIQLAILNIRKYIEFFNENLKEQYKVELPTNFTGNDRIDNIMHRSLNNMW